MIISLLAQNSQQSDELGFFFVLRSTMPLFEVKKRAAEELSTAAKRGRDSGDEADKRQTGGAGGSYGGNAEETKLKEVVTWMAELTLGNTKSVAETKACIVLTVLFSTIKSDLQKEVKAATAQYREDCQKMSPQQKTQNCSPHVVAWNAAIKCVEEEAKGNGAPQISETMTNLVKTFIQEIQAGCGGNSETAVTEKMIKDHVAKTVGIFKADVCKDESKAKVLFYTQPGTTAHSMQQLIVDYLVKNCQGEIKYGPPPPGPLERKLQKWLNAQKRRS